MYIAEFMIQDVSAGIVTRGTIVRLLAQISNCSLLQSV